MKANELRIGNLLYRETIDPKDIFKKIEFVFAVKANDIRDATLYGEDFNADPIPITEEWLERFGFRFNKDHYDWELICGRKAIRIADSGDNDFGLIYRHDVGIDFSWIDFVEYIHQLQNLYFALTGEELTIKK